MPNRTLGTLHSDMSAFSCGKMLSQDPLNIELTRVIRIILGPRSLGRWCHTDHSRDRARHRQPGVYRRSDRETAAPSARPCAGDRPRPRLGDAFAFFASTAWIVTLQSNLFTIFGNGFSGRDLILILGGLCLLFKGTVELHERLEGHHAPKEQNVSPIPLSHKFCCKSLCWMPCSRSIA